MYNEKSSVPVLATQLWVESQQAADALNEILTTLAESDPQLCYDFTTAAPNIILSGAGELHLQKTLIHLRTVCPFAIQTSAPYALYRETVSAKSYAEPVGMVRSANKVNQFFAYAEPLSDALVEALEQGALSNLSKPALAAYLQNQHGWNATQAHHVWRWGPRQNPTNCLVDGTNGKVEIPDEVRKDCLLAFEDICQAGALAEEPLRGVKVVITNTHLSLAARQRGGSQIIPAIRRLIMGLQLISCPRLVEAVYTLDINTQASNAAAIRDILARRQAIDVHFDQDENLRFYLPVAASLGLADELAAVLTPTCQADLTFTHWQTINYSPFEPSVSTQYIREIRSRKGLTESPYHIANYLDKP